MSLENSKRYGAPLLQQSLLEKSKDRLAAVTPHQAPQRERVSASTSSPKAAAARVKRRASAGRGWKAQVRPDVNMGVPQLLMILEPNVVWEHTKDYVGSLEQSVQATCCSHSFFEGSSQQGRMAHGVYEGNYWQLLGDLVELEGTLEKLAARAPQDQQEPVLELPPPPTLPQWEDFKPTPLPAPEPPSTDPPAMPHFRPPRLPTEVAWQQPELLPVPPLPPALKDAIPPTYQPPAAPVIEPYEQQEAAFPELPPLPEAPSEPVFGAPKHGHDWSGERPFTLPEATYQPPQLPPEPAAALPTVTDPQLQEAKLDLQPAPVLQLAWFQDPEAAAAAAAEAASEAHSNAASGTHSPVRPLSAGVPSARATKSRPSSAVQAAAAQLDAALRRMSREELQQQWQEVQAVDAGQPHVWLDFKAPFAEPPPLVLPPKPSMGPEPVMEEPWDLQEMPVFVQPELQAHPVWHEPSFIAPSWVPPTEPKPVGFLRGAGPVLIMDVSGTMHPARMGQFNRMKGCVAQLLAPDGEMATAAQDFDVIAFASAAWSWSAVHESKQAMLRTLHTPHQGRQAGCRPASAAAGRLAKLARDSPGLQDLSSTAASNSMHQQQQQPQQQLQQQNPSLRSSLQLQPADAEHLAAAQAWVEGWPAATGHTALGAALTMAHGHAASADSWYLFTDGLADDSAACLEFVEQQQRVGVPVPPIHTVGFFPRNARDGVGERFLRHLSDITGGTFQVYDGDFLGPNMAKMFHGSGEGLVPYDLSAELPSDRSERLWAEEQLKLERRQALRDGHAERIDAVLQRLQERHHDQRVMPALAAHERRLAVLRHEHEARCAAMQKANDKAVRRAGREHGKLVDKVTAANVAKVAAAQARHQAAIAKWHADHQAAVTAWERTVADIKAAAAAAPPPQPQPWHGQIPTATANQQHSTGSTHAEPMQAANIQHVQVAAGASDAGQVQQQEAYVEVEAAEPIESVEPNANGSGAAPKAQLQGTLSDSNVSDHAISQEGAAKIPSLPLERIASLASVGAWESTPRVDAKTPATAARVVGSAGGAPAAPAAAAGLAGLRRTASAVPNGSTSSGGSGNTFNSAGGSSNARRLRTATSVSAGGANSRAHTPLHRTASAALPTGSAGANVAGLKRLGSAVDRSTGGAASRSQSAAGAAPGASNYSSGSNGRGSPAAGKQAGAGTGRPTSATGKGSSSRPKSGNRPGSSKGKGSSKQPRSILDGAEWAEEGSPDDCDDTVPLDLDTICNIDEEASHHYFSGTSAQHNAAVAHTSHARSQAAAGHGAGKALVSEPSMCDAEADAAVSAVPGTPEYVAEMAQLVEQRNRDALQQAQHGWAEAVHVTEHHNTQELQRTSLQKAMKDSMHQRGVSAREAWLKMRDEAVAAAEEAYRVACAEVLQQNAAIAALHRQEVAARRKEEAAHAQALQNHSSLTKKMVQQHQEHLAAAKAEHEALVEQERQQWETRRQQLLDQHEQALQRTSEEHAALVQQMKESNRRAREEHTAQSAAHREATRENRRRMAEAQTAHQAANAALIVENQRAMEAARLAHEHACAQAQLNAIAAAAGAEEAYAAACAAVEQQNADVLESARRAYQEAIERLLLDHEERCSALRAQHAAQVAAVQAHNKGIAPLLRMAQLVLSELARVRIFAAHMRACAAKLQLGVNFMRNTPNLDRVVEMDALTEGLQKAFPEFEPRQYPWPHTAPQQQQQQPTPGDMTSRSFATLAFTNAAANGDDCQSDDDTDEAALEQLQGPGTWRANPKQPVQLSHYQDPALAISRMLAGRHLAAARPKTAPAQARAQSSSSGGGGLTGTRVTWMTMPRHHHSCSDDDAFHGKGCSSSLGSTRNQMGGLMHGSPGARPQTAPAQPALGGAYKQQQQCQQQHKQLGSGSWEAAAGHHALMRPVSAGARRRQQPGDAAWSDQRLQQQHNAAAWPSTAAARPGSSSSARHAQTSAYEASLKAVYLGQGAGVSGRQRPSSAPRAVSSQNRPARHSVDSEWMMRCMSRQ